MSVTPEELETFLNNIGPFSHGFLQDFMTFLDFLYAKGISIDHAYNCIGQQRINVAEKVDRLAEYRLAIESKECPECGGEMRLVRVNDKPSTMVGGDWKTLWYCLDDVDCSYEEYSTDTMREAIKRRNHPNRLT